MPKDRVDEYAHLVSHQQSPRRSRLPTPTRCKHQYDLESHEPTSILHELVWHRNYESMRFLIDRGIDMTIKDYRWNSTAQGWARYAANDETLAQWLEEAQRKQQSLMKVGEENFKL